MQINPITSALAFGKRPVGVCNIKSRKSDKDRTAVLYQMDPKNSDDQKEMASSKYTRNIVNDFTNSKDRHFSVSEFFILQDVRTNGIVAAAEIARRYSREGRYYLSLCEVDKNPNYKNPARPIIGYLAGRAKKFNQETILTSFRTCEHPSLKKEGFRETGWGNLRLDQEKYDRVLARVIEENSAVFD